MAHSSLNNPVIRCSCDGSHYTTPSQVERGRLRMRSKNYCEFPRSLPGGVMFCSFFLIVRALCFRGPQRVFKGFSQRVPTDSPNVFQGSATCFWCSRNMLQSSSVSCTVFQEVPIAYFGGRGEDSPHRVWGFGTGFFREFPHPVSGVPCNVLEGSRNEFRVVPTMFQGSSHRVSNCPRSMFDGSQQRILRALAVSLKEGGGALCSAFRKFPQPIL